MSQTIEQVLNEIAHTDGLSVDQVAARLLQPVTPESVGAEPAGTAESAVERGAYSDNLIDSVFGPRLDPWPNPYPGALFCIIIDDGASAALQDTTGICGLSAGISPERYLQAAGIPVGIAMPSDRVGTTGCYTAAELRERYLQRGWSIISHSKTHSSQPTTAALIESEVVSSKAALEALTDSTLTLHPEIGIRVKGFVQPGTWTGEANGDDVAKAANDLWHRVRQTYAYSTAYLAGTGRHMRKRFGWPSTDFLEYCAAQGAKYCFYCHAQPPGTPTYGLPSTFKAVIDKLLELRAAGRAQVVAPDEYFAAQGNATPPGCDYGGTFEWADYAIGSQLAASAALDLRSSRGWYFYQPSDGGSFYIRDAGDGTKCLEIHRGTSLVKCYRLLNNVQVDRPVRLMFDAKLTAAGASASYLDILLTVYDSAGGSSSALLPVASVYLAAAAGQPDLGQTSYNGVALAEGWKHYEVCFRVPVWAGGYAPTALHIWTPNASAGNGMTALIDNVRVVQ